MRKERGYNCCEICLGDILNIGSSTRFEGIVEIGIVYMLCTECKYIYPYEYIKNPEELCCGQVPEE